MTTTDEARQRYRVQIPDALIREDFLYREPREDCAETLRALAEDFTTLARRVNEVAPCGRAKTHAIKHLEEAFMWAKTSIKRNQPSG